MEYFNLLNTVKVKEIRNHHRGSHSSCGSISTKLINSYHFAHEITLMLNNRVYSAPARSITRKCLKQRFKIEHFSHCFT